MWNFKNVDEEVNKLHIFIKLITNPENYQTILNFLKWFKLKIITFNKNPIKKFPKEWEIWNIRLWKNIWSEQNGEKDGWYVRPCLVIKVFSARNDNIIVLPLTKSKKPDFISFILEKSKYNYMKFDKSYILLDQVRTVSKKRLIWKPLWAIAKSDFNQIIQKFKWLFKEK